MKVNSVFDGWLRREEVDVILPYTAGNGIDVCCGHKTWPGAVGIDRTPWGESWTPGAQPSVAQLVYDALDLPFKDGTLDYVFCCHGLEHLDNVETALREWARVLKPGGHLCLLTPDVKYVVLVTKNGKVPHGLEPEDVKRIVAGIPGLELVSIDTLKNKWSFELIACKT